jgi:nitrite reductase (NO-forming)
MSPSRTALLPRLIERNALKPATTPARAGAGEEFIGRGPHGLGASAGRMALIAFLTVLTSGLSARAVAGEKSFTLTVEGKAIAIGGRMLYKTWTYDGQIPGPTLMVQQDDEVTINLVNNTPYAHGVNVHAAQILPEHFSGDPAKQVSFTFRAEVAGVFPYHCNAIPILNHIAGGMYGAIIVQPKGGWPHGDAQDVILVQSEFYGRPDANGMFRPNHARMLDALPDFVVFNGAINKYTLDNPIMIKAGKLVRIFFLNAGPNLRSAFHISGTILQTVYRGGNPSNPVYGVDGLEVAPGEGAVIEFMVKEPGDYQFMDLEYAHEYKGAIGIFRAK